MKILIPSLILAGAGLASAAVIQFDISPNAGALSTTNYIFGRDHGVGLSALNEAAGSGSPATGNEMGPGIRFDTVTKQLSFTFAYGSVFGFTNLLGPYIAGYIYGALSGPTGLSNFPAPNTSAGVLFGLAPFHRPAGLQSGIYVGAVTLSPPQEIALMQNRFYINIHSAFAPDGEIRGQLVAVPEPSAALLGALGVFSLIRRRRN